MTKRIKIRVRKPRDTRQKRVHSKGIDLLNWKLPRRILNHRVEMSYKGKKLADVTISTPKLKNFRVPVYHTGTFRAKIEGKWQDVSGHVGGVYAKGGVVLNSFGKSKRELMYNLRHELGHAITEKEMGIRRYQRLSTNRREEMADRLAKKLEIGQNVLSFKPVEKSKLEKEARKHRD